MPRIVARLAYLHYLVAAISLTYFVAGWYCFDISIVSDWPDGGQGMVISDSRGIDRHVEDPVLLTYSFGLIGAFAIVVGTGLLKLKRWARKWAWCTPLATLMLWAPAVWIGAKWRVYGRLGRSTDPASLDRVTPVADIWHAATAVLVMWAVISLAYYLVLHSKIVRNAFAEAGGRTNRRFHVAGLGVALAMLVALICFRMSDGRMLIHDVSSYGWTEAVAILTHCGQGVGAHSRDGRTPLHYAAAAGRLDAANYLLDHGADINGLDRQGESPAVLAAKGRYSFYGGHNNDCQKVLVYLLKRGADVRTPDEDILIGLLGSPPSDPSALPGPKADYREDYVRLLLQRGFPVNSRASLGYTLMDYAVECGNARDIDYLLSHGARMYPRLAMYASPANLAHLLGRGLDIRARDGDGKTALYYVLHAEMETSGRDRRERVRLLTEHGADINANANQCSISTGADTGLQPDLVGRWRRGR